MVRSRTKTYFSQPAQVSLSDSVVYHMIVQSRRVLFAVRLRCKKGTSNAIISLTCSLMHFEMYSKFPVLLDDSKDSCKVLRASTDKLERKGPMLMVFKAIADTTEAGSPSSAVGKPMTMTSSWSAALRARLPPPLKLRTMKSVLSWVIL